MIENDLGLKRDDLFESRMGVKVLPAPPDTIPDTANGSAPSAAKTATATGKAPAPPPLRFLALENPSTVQSVWNNLHSGVLSWPDLFLVAFSILDLVSQPSIWDNVLQRLTVDGFLYSQRYATDNCADLHDMILMEIWSIHSNQTSASAYKTFFQHAFGLPYGRPFAWLLNGNLQDKLIAPLEQKLRSLGCDIQTSTRVVSIKIVNGVPQLRLQQKQSKAAKVAPATRHVVLAVPPAALYELVKTGSDGVRVVDYVPCLSELRRLRAEQIPVINLYFKRQLVGIPKEHVGLARTDFYLTFLDISQLWTSLSQTEPKRTVLVLAASDAFALPPAGLEEQGFLMIQKLYEYLPVFNPGSRWGDANSDIDWDETWVAQNDSNKLFINEVGSSEWQPQASYSTLPSVSFAGDFCLNDVGMATVEAAVLSGIQAAQAVQKRFPRGHAIVCAPRKAPSLAGLLALKLALLPAAYAAKGWSAIDDAIPYLAKGNISQGVILPGEIVMTIPFNLAVDWCATAYGFWLHLLKEDVPVPASSPAPRAAVRADATQRTQVSEQEKAAPESLSTLAAKLASGFNHLMENLAEQQAQVVGGPPSVNPPIGPSAAAVRLWRAARLVHAAAQAPEPARPYRRRWRAKA